MFDINYKLVHRSVGKNDYRPKHYIIKAFQKEPQNHLSHNSYYIHEYKDFPRGRWSLFSIIHGLHCFWGLSKENKEARVPGYVPIPCPHHRGDGLHESLVTRSASHGSYRARSLPSSDQDPQHLCPTLFVSLPISFCCPPTPYSARTIECVFKNVLNREYRVPYSLSPSSLDSSWFPAWVIPIVEFISFP